MATDMMRAWLNEHGIVIPSLQSASVVTLIWQPRQRYINYYRIRVVGDTADEAYRTAFAEVKAHLFRKCNGH